MSKFPIYYYSKSTGQNYKVEGIDHIDIDNNKIYYRGIKVQQWNRLFKIQENVCFQLPDDKIKMSEEEFNNALLITKYNLIGAFPIYLMNQKNDAYMKVTDIKMSNNTLMYFGSIINPTIIATYSGGTMPTDFKNFGWTVCTKEDYEKALDTVISKLKNYYE